MLYDNKSIMINAFAVKDILPENLEEDVYQ